MNHLYAKTALLVILVVISTDILITSCKTKEKQESTPPSLKIMEIKGKQIPVYLEMVGQAVVIPTVEIRARVAGYLQTWSFMEGSVIQNGQSLFTIEKDSYINTLKFNEADVDNKTAAWEKAKLDVARLKPLLSINAISQNDYDKAVTTEQQDRAAVASSKADLDEAKLNLSYCSMTSPITGYIGACNVRPGNLVGKGESTLLATVSAINPIYVNFQMSETDYLKIMRWWSEHKDEYKDKKNGFKVFLSLSDKMEYNQPGEIDFFDRDVNPQTGTIALRAVFPNPEGLIKPGNFAQIYLVLLEQQNWIVIPHGATTQIQCKFFAFKVDQENKVTRVPVDLGRSTGNLIIVNGGLAIGDRILLEGFQKFQEGMKINPVNVPDTLTVNQRPN